MGPRNRRRIKTLRLIVNPTSGGGRAARLLPEVLAGLVAVGYEVETLITRSLDHARELTIDAVSVGAVIGVMGGDGLTSAVGTTLAETSADLPLAIFPAGRGNDFARALGFTKVKEAVEVVANGHEKLIDVGVVNGQSFLAVSSVGFDSVVLKRANAAKSLPGSLSYPYAVIRELLTWKSAHFDVTLDGQLVSFDGYSVIVANGSFYGGAMKVAPNAKVDDGLFDVVMIKQVGRVRFLIEAAKVFKGKHVGSSAVIMRQAKDVTVKASRNFALHIDGELDSHLPASFTLKPASLRVFVP